MIAATLGLLAFAAAIERCFFRRATILETFLFLAAAAGLLCPGIWYDLGGLIAMTGALSLQKFYKSGG